MEDPGVVTRLHCSNVLTRIVPTFTLPYNYKEGVKEMLSS